MNPAMFDPSGGRDITGTTGFIGTGLAIDLLRPFLLNKKTELLESRLKKLKYNSERRFWRNNVVDARDPTRPPPPTPIRLKSMPYGPRQLGTRLSRDGSSIERTYTHRLTKRIGNLKRTSSSLKAISWSLFGLGTIAAVENLVLPGVNRITQERDEMSIAREMYTDSAAAYTQRQRALQAIYDSQSNMGQVLGNESRYFHR